MLGNNTPCDFGEDPEWSSLSESMRSTEFLLFSDKLPPLTGLRRAMIYGTKIMFAVFGYHFRCHDLLASVKSRQLRVMLSWTARDERVSTR